MHLIKSVFFQEWFYSVHHRIKIAQQHGVDQSLKNIIISILVFKMLYF